MATINLREYYPEYGFDCIIEVTDGDEAAFTGALTKEIADVYAEYQRAENAYRRKKYRHKGNYSIDAGDGIEHEALGSFPSPEDIIMEELMEKHTRELLYGALAALPERQRRRIEAHYIYSVSKTAIAEAEGADESSVRESIERGISSMKKYLSKFM